MTSCYRRTSTILQKCSAPRAAVQLHLPIYVGVEGRETHVAIGARYWKGTMILTQEYPREQGQLVLVQKHSIKIHVKKSVQCQLLS